MEMHSDIDILVVDDSSPDGTAEVVRRKAAAYPAVHLLSRPAKAGIGGAHRAGLKWAYENGYVRAATMDADLTHAPSDLKRLLDTSSDEDVFVASRFMSEGGLPGWSILRRFLTWGGHIFTRVALRLPYDATGALRVYRIDRIPFRIFELSISNGYGFIAESLFWLHFNGFKIRELPVVLPARIIGSSKMSFREIRRSVVLICSYGVARIFYPERLRIVPQTGLGSRTACVAVPTAWDPYWSARLRPTFLLYDILAGIYRRWIIRPPFERVIRKTFPPGSKLLHAGCGSGQVDSCLGNSYSITALDYSQRALELYLAVNGSISPTILGSIEQIPAPDESFDGVYNLGVMEHFPRENLIRALSEFRRVLKPEGKIVLWWPPEYGFSVRLLSAIGAVLNCIGLSKDREQLFPEECSKIQNRAWVNELLMAGGLRLVSYDFGIQDLCTQVVVTAVKNDR